MVWLCNSKKRKLVAKHKTWNNETKQRWHKPETDKSCQFQEEYANVISPSPLNTLWRQQMSSRPLPCSWFDQGWSSEQAEKWRHVFLQSQTSIWKHAHIHTHAFDLIHTLTLGNMLFGNSPAVAYNMTFLLFHGHCYKWMLWGQSMSRNLQPTSRRLQDLNVFWK